MKQIQKSAILAGLILALSASLAACGAETENNPSATEAETQTETAAVTDDGFLHDAVPELNFNGYTFRTVEQEGKTFPLTVASETGEVINDAAYRRNKQIEERFNIVFAEVLPYAYNVIPTMVENSVMSGSDDYDLVFGQMFQSASTASKGIYLDWTTVPYLELSNPWYTKSIQDSSIGSHLYMIESDLALSYTEQTWMIVYNKDRYRELFPDGEKLYDLVDSGKWTLDYLNMLVKDCYQDTNGNGKRDAEDFYGLGSYQDGCQVAAFYYGTGNRLAVLKEDLTLEHTIAQEKSIDAITKLAEIFNGGEGSIRKSDNLIKGFFDGRALFVQNRLLFTPMQVGHLMSGDMREFEGDFGVLPLPKYNEEQSEYYTGTDGGADIMVIPSAVREDQMNIIGAVVEAMSCVSYNEFIPTYCAEGLSAKGTRDEESIAMLRKILDSRVIDFSYLYDGGTGWVMKLPGMLTSPQNCASAIETNTKKVNDHFSTIIDYLMSEN